MSNYVNGNFTRTVKATDFLTFKVKLVDGKPETSVQNYTAYGVESDTLASYVSKTFPAGTAFQFVREYEVKITIKENDLYYSIQSHELPAKVEEVKPTEEESAPETTPDVKSEKKGAKK